MAKGLKENALSIVDTLTLAVAGSAPSYSLNATTAALVAAVGLAGPAALLFGAIPMFGISFAFKYLNEWRADAGAAYVWVGRSIAPALGFLAAWTFLLLSTVFMVTAALPLGVATLHLAAPAYESSVPIAAFIGGLWFSGAVALTIGGVHLAASVQRYMTGFEALALLVLVVAAYLRFSAAPVHPFSLAWFSPAAFGDVDTFMRGMLVAVFYYFGWDVTSNVAEEAQGKGESGGLSGVIGMVGIMCALIAVQVAVQTGMSVETVEQHGANILGALGDAVLPQPWSNIAVLAVVLSTVGTIDTQLTQCARLLYAMGRDRVMDPRFAEIHPRFQTPWLAGVVIWLLSIVLIALSSASDSVGGVMAQLISAIGVMVSIYYGLTGAACVWYYRRTLTRTAGTLVMRGLWPGLSAAFLLYLGVRQTVELGRDVVGLTVLALALGLPLMAFYRARFGAAFYTEPSEHDPAA
ncbi:MAG: APC family permease [Vicinamibacterales bacterium]